MTTRALEPFQRRESHRRHVKTAAAAKSNHGGRPKVIDDDMLTFAAASLAYGSIVVGT